MDDCLQQLMDRIDAGEGEQLKNLILSERLAKLVRMRLEMQAPYISKWPQALSIQVCHSILPLGLWVYFSHKDIIPSVSYLTVSTSLKQRAVLVDEIWHAAGDAGSDIDWYVKRTVLGGIYSTSEVYMLTDNSPGLHFSRTLLVSNSCLLQVISGRSFTVWLWQQGLKWKKDVSDTLMNCQGFRMIYNSFSLDIMPEWIDLWLTVLFFFESYSSFPFPKLSGNA